MEELEIKPGEESATSSDLPPGGPVVTTVGGVDQDDLGGEQYTAQEKPSSSSEDVIAPGDNTRTAVPKTAAAPAALMIQIPSSYTAGTTRMEELE
ncbi:unnamed protein product, partial [Amoebophrya sp. A120]|eukprot:GSA120T00023209001.1